MTARDQIADPWCRQPHDPGIPKSPKNSPAKYRGFPRVESHPEPDIANTSLRYATKRIYAAPLYRTIQSTEPPPARCHAAHGPAQRILQLTLSFQAFQDRFRFSKTFLKTLHAYRLYP